MPCFDGLDLYDFSKANAFQKGHLHNEPIYSALSPASVQPVNRMGQRSDRDQVLWKQDPKRRYDGSVTCRKYEVDDHLAVLFKTNIVARHKPTNTCLLIISNSSNNEQTLPPHIFSARIHGVLHPKTTAWHSTSVWLLIHRKCPDSLIR